MSATFFQYVRSRFQALVYSSPLYRVWLDQEQGPDTLKLTMADAWPGNVDEGQKIIARQVDLYDGEGFETPSARHDLLAHNWLRDLRAVGTDTARRTARALLEEWLDHYDNWQAESWAHDVLGERLFNWICFYDFYAASAAKHFTRRLTASMMRQARHLARTLPVNLTGISHLRAVRGLSAASLALFGDDAALAMALEALKRQLFAEILGDGGHVSRNPLVLLHIVRGLIDVRALLGAARRDVPHELATAIERMAPALKLFRHGDGALALFNGSDESTSLLLDATVTLSGIRSRAQRRLPQMGYERVTMGRSLLLVDVGAPPHAPFDKAAHAGLLSFEMSVGRERLIVNCGTGPCNDASWCQAMAATAAHSTLTVNETNACEILSQGGIGHRPKQVTSQRYEQNDDHYVEATHDGYADKFHVTCRRSLCLAAEGEELHGRDVLTGSPGQEFVIRWHLHPSVQASLGQGGQTALLRLPSGSGWRLRIDGATLSLEPSVYGGDRRAPRRSLQLKASGITHGDVTEINWLLAREKKG